MDFYFIIEPFIKLINDPVFKYFFWISTAISFLCWIATVLTDNYSQVDRLWSLLPPAYAWGFLYVSIQHLNQQFSSPSFYRLVAMTVLPTLWGARLTYNFWRKGGYNLSTEDYRWIHVRKMFDFPRRKLLWHLFNFSFTAFLQNYLLLALVLPMWKSIPSSMPLNLADFTLIAAFLTFLLIETIADQQQWNFQTNKYKWLATKKGYSKEEVDSFKRGFLITGVFSYSRHPNFFAELSIWWTYYLFSLSSQFQAFSDIKLNALVNYSIVGVFVLTLIFHGSTNLTEKITKAKYPEYGKYQQYVSRIIPFFTTYKPK